MNATTIPTAELNNLIGFYRESLKGDCKDGRTLANVEVREAWTAFRRLLREKYRRLAQVQANPHLYN